MLERKSGPGARLREILADEDASAAVELVVLIPVYLTLMVALFTTGQLVLARQGVVLATRFAAWQAQDAKRASSDDLSRAFFAGGLHNDSGQGSGGTYAHQVDRRETWRPAQQDLQLEARDRDRVADGSLDRSEVATLALAFLENRATVGGGGEDRPTLVWSRAAGTFTYRASWIPIFGIGQSPIVTPRTRAVTLLPSYESGRYVERKAHVSEHQDHPIERFGVAGRTFRPSNEKYFSPTDGPGDPRIPEQSFGSGPPGIWDPDYRLGGSVFVELQHVKRYQR